MLLITISSIALAVMVSAQEITSLYVPVVGTALPLYGSVIASKSETTTYAIMCGNIDHTVNEDMWCPIPAGIIMTQGPGTMVWTASGSYYDEEIQSTYYFMSGTVGCTVPASAPAVCTISLVSLGASAFEVTTLDSPIETDLSERPVTLTSLDITWTTSATASPLTTEAPMASISESTPKETGVEVSRTSNGVERSSTGTQQAAKETSSSTAMGVAMVTAYPNAWIVGGAAFVAAAIL